MKTNITRREFLQISGTSAAAMALSACGGSVTGHDNNQGQMEMRHCGTDNVGLLGYGCMRWPKAKDQEGNEIIDQEKVNQLVDYAIAHGVNYFDSSPVYTRGMSEEATAAALLRHPRETYYIATKLSNFRNWSYENSVAMYRRSLEIYQTDYIDYYLLHSLDGEQDFHTRYLDTGTMDFLLKEREQGHIRKLGFSYHGDKEGFDYLLSLHTQYHWDFVQIQMNYIDWSNASKKETDASYLYNALDALGIPVVIMEPLLGGSLADVPGPVSEALLSREPGNSVASWAFRFCGSYPRVLTILSGMTYMEHLSDNIETFSHFKALTAEEMELLQSMTRIILDYPLIKCTGCNYCMPCPYGIDIPGIFHFYNQSIKQGSFIQSKEQEHYSRLRRRYLTQYNRAIPTIRQADHCICCGKCVKACPQRIKIPQKMQEINKYIENVKQGKI